MNLGQLRAHVRTYLDVEAEELPDPLLDLFLQEGFDRIVRYQQRWPWLEGQWDIELVPNVGSYELAATAPGLTEVSSVILAGDCRLGWMGHTDAESRYATGSVSTGTPRSFSTWGSRLYVWPIPTTNGTLQVRGYRTPTDWISMGSGAEPDCPVEFHGLVARWALACEYERQDDTEMAAYNRDHFNDELDRLAKASTAMPIASPIAIGGGRRHGTPFNGQPWPFD